MKQLKCHTRANFLGICLIFFGTLALYGCSIKLVADYDVKTFEEILNVGKEVDKFYGTLLEMDENDRKYQKFSEKYVDIETELRSLNIRNKSRPLNDESIKISQSILGLWIKYKEKHKSKNKYSNGNAKLDRNRFERLFISAASAEAAKKLDPGDKDVAKDSKTTTK